MIKLVAFDWNGTLFADTQTVVDAGNHFITAMGGKPITLATYRQKFIVPVADFYESVGLDRKTVLKNSQKNAEIFHKYYELKAWKLRTRANTHNLLEWLYNNKIKCIIISNHVIHRIEEQVERLKIDKFIATIIANVRLDDALKEKNKKEKLKNFVRSQKISSKEVLIVGDSTEEIEIAKELKSISVAITHGHCATSRLKAAKPDYLVNNLREIVDIVNKFN